MSLTEKRVSILVLVVLFSLSGIALSRRYHVVTKTIPNFGGSYSEALVGEIKFLDPILSNTDADDSVGHLLFSDLIEYSNGVITPGVAKSWEISPDGLKYALTIRDDVYFSDGEKLDIGDILFTFGRIKDPAVKSPLYQTWKDITVDKDEQNRVTFTLQKPYGPLLSKCDFGILPDHIDDATFSKKYIGSGPYKLDKVKKEGERVSEIVLKSNSKYFKGRPYINKMTIELFQDETKARKAYEDGNVMALFGPSSSIGTSEKYNSSRKLGLILNLRQEKFKDKTVRQKILSQEKFDEKFSFNLVTLDSPAQRAKAEELKTKMADQNISVEISYKNVLSMQDTLKTKNYEALLYGFDFGNDADPYIFWHSSQIGELNFAGFSDKTIDQLIEAARGMTDDTARKQKYDQVYSELANQYVVQYFDNFQYNYSYSDRIMGVSASDGNEAGSRYANVEKWYLKEKRVRR